MKVFRLLPVIALAPVLVLLSGCNDDDPKFSTPSSTTVSPGLGRFNLASTGGRAIGLPGRSAGGGGDVSLSVTGGQLKRDDGRAFPTPNNNVLTNALIDDNVVTYAEFQSIPGYSIAAGVGTLNLTGEGFDLPNGIALDLSGAPFTGSAPATDIETIEIITDEAIRLDGNVVTTREDNHSVNIVFTSTHAEGVTVRGNIDTTGDERFNGGDVSVSAPNGPVLMLGRVNASGGNATATVDAGDGGDITVSAGAGDLLLRGGTITLNGGEAEQDGGNGGSVLVTIDGAGTSDFAWSADLRGGHGADGDGGNGGDFTMNAVGLVVWFAAIFNGGGHGETDTGSDGGGITLTATEHGGALSLNTSGGDVNSGSGGNGGTIVVDGTATGLEANANTTGGRGDVGGLGGNFVVLARGAIFACVFGADTRGGHGANDGGGGGDCVILFSSGNVLVQQTTVNVNASGGNGATGTGGGGGDVGVFGGGGNSATVVDCLFDAATLGGNGDTGGNGGTFGISTGAGGTVHGELHFDLSGGESDTGTGGTGGTFMLSAEGGIDAVVSGFSYGGFGPQGGQGGDFVAMAEGTIWITGTFTGRGGASDADGGAGGSVIVQTNSLFGAITLDKASLSVNGGNGVTTGGSGGTVTVSAAGTLLQTRGGLTANGGNATTGSGGAAGTLAVMSDDDDILVDGLLRAVGGRGDTAGGTGGSVVVDSDDDGANDAGDITLLGVINVEGGDSPGGTGGDGGMVSVTATATVGVSGSISAESDIRAGAGFGITPGPVGGSITLVTDGPQLSVTGRLWAGAEGEGDGGNISLEDGQFVVLGVNSELRANGAGTGTAGFITLDPAGAGPNNPALVELPGSIVETQDGDGTDQSAANVTRD